MYKLMKDGIVVCLDTQIQFPSDPANTDYQQYLAWLAEGNTPEPADEPAQGEQA